MMMRKTMSYPQHRPRGPSIRRHLFFTINVLVATLSSFVGASVFSSAPVLLGENLSFVTDMQVVDDAFHDDTLLLVAGPQFVEVLLFAANNSTVRIVPPNTRGAEKLAMADFNQDGILDLVVTSSNDFVTQPPTNGAIVSLYPGVVVSDNEEYRLVEKTVLLNDTSTQQLLQSQQAMNGRSMRVGDFNRDGSADLVVIVSPNSFVSPQAGYVLALINNGDGSSFETIVIDQELNGPALVEVADLNQDGFLDLVLVEITTRPGTRPLKVWYGADDGELFEDTSVTIDDGTRGNMAISVSDLNNDGVPDIMTMGLQDIVVYFGTSTGREFVAMPLASYDPLLHLSVNYRDWNIQALDVDSDGLLDILAIFGLGDDVKWMRQLSDGTFSDLESLVAASTVGKLALHDLNKDGSRDMILHSEMEQKLYVFYSETDPESSSVPSQSPSTVTPETGVPTGSPSTAPVRATDVPSDMPSPSPTTASPSDSPSDQPSLLPTELVESSEPLSAAPSFDSASEYPSEVPSEVPSQSDVPSSSPTETCLPLGAACTSDAECCGFGPNLICVGICRIRQRERAKGESKLFAQLLLGTDEDRGNLTRRQRKLRGS